MHLLDVRTRRLKKYVEERDGCAVDKYATLSHRWMDRDEEVLYQDIESGKCEYKKKKGHEKLDNCCKQAIKDGLDYVWIDTCCIDKSNSAELQEAINSMFRYYRNSTVCYVHLRNTIKGGPGYNRLNEKDDWFERGWTLQELVAPQDVRFFDREWQFIGEKTILSRDLEWITGIHEHVLLHAGRETSFTIAQRMSWASRRKTTKDEDLAYCLIGIFGVNMPMLYGEGGTKAFLRLQEEIIKTSDDKSIFAWEGASENHGLLATNVAAFRNSRNIRSIERRSGQSPFSMTNRGLSITLTLRPWCLDSYLAMLDCTEDGRGAQSGMKFELGVILQRSKADDQYSRISLKDGTDLYRTPPVRLRSNGLRIERPVSIFVKDVERPWIYGNEILNGFRINNPFATSTSIGGHWDPERHVVTVEPGTNELGCVGELKLSRCGKIRMAQFGFDFDFNPTILLREAAFIPIMSFYNASIEPAGSNGTMSVWRDPQGVPLEWNHVGNWNGRTASENRRPGLWVLKGDRFNGLRVHLGTTGIIVAIRRRMNRKFISQWIIWFTNDRQSPRMRRKYYYIGERPIEGDDRRRLPRHRGFYDKDRSEDEYDSDESDQSWTTCEI